MNAISLEDEEEGCLDIGGYTDNIREVETVRQGAFKGIPNLQNPILNAGKKQTDNLGAENGKIKGQSSGDNLAVIETKKRRTSEDSDTNERNKDIIMGTENDILTVINEDTLNNINDSKNGFVAAQDLVKQGVSCNVGDGHSIPIMGVPWLPNEIDPYIHTTSESLVNQKVNALMVTGTKQWDDDLISDIFVDRDAQLIMSIPISDGINDNWFWRKDKLGIYSVKSAYLMLQTADERSRNSNSGFWRKLWNLKIPLKVKHFLWRVRAKLRVITGEYQSFGEWLQNVFDHSTTEEIKSTVMLCWMIWKNRNDLVWSQKSSSAQELVYSAFSILNQWQAVQDSVVVVSLGFLFPEDGQTSWQAPAQNKVKINTDAALFKNTNRYIRLNA
ncbi:hypothetical protein POM88_008434 [Heracleum sosnowskyi]|uniref:Reverse transcriptase zinc-binding domain-containing protein n=1 Tax=Heracleum sosnowskyi TaxID=360622 RepID=A0AAD8J7D2_9APIA|nr:hypothetical protein POM88_008434 [Heracleum sosnowskyi]